MGSLIGGLASSTSYSAAAPPINKQDFNPDLGTAQSTVMSNIGAQQTLAKSLQDIAMGVGPNPVQAQYQNNVNQNAQQMAGAIGSQKGISQGLAARLIANNTENANQNAAGQGAVNQLNQQIAATNQQASVLNNIGSQAAANQGTLQNANSNQNTAINTGSLGVQGINSGVAQGNTAGRNGLAGSLISGAAGAGAAMLGRAAHGGIVPGQELVHGNSFANDTEDFKLSPGEIVIDKVHAAQSPKKIAEFIAALKKAGPEKSSTTARNDYSKVLESQRMLHQRLTEIQSMLKVK